MGIVAGYQEVLADAVDYREKLQAFSAGNGDEPLYDPKLAAVATAMNGDAQVHFHCYRAEDIAVVQDVADHYGLPITAYHHAAEAYKIPERFAGRGVCAVVFANWWGFKMENYDAIRENAAFMEAAGACVALHSDSSATDPFSIYTKADLVFIDGARAFDRAEPERQPLSDFMLGQPVLERQP